MIGKSVTIVRHRPDMHRTFTTRGVVTDVNRDDAGRTQGVCVRGARDDGTTEHGWFAVGPNGLDGSLVASQTCTVNACGHEIYTCTCA
jgi:hypothetical protein